MGWFWAETGLKTPAIVAPHPIPKDGTTPPPSCPMHNASSPLLNSVTRPTGTSATTQAQSSCPVKSPAQPSRYPTSNSEPSNAPVKLQPEPSTTSTISKLNPLNYMPTLNNTRLAESPQNVDLPLEREPSSIPRGDADTNWEYPSPQQMYNAMLRKGYTDTPVDAVESMVAIHNFLNEGAWEEIVQWENLFAQGLLKGWERCREGEEGIARDKARRDFIKERREAMGRHQISPDEEVQPKLLRFQGRPKEPTPKSRILQALSKVFPESFSTDPPFDRHDWFVSRTLPNGSTKERRYVIDYYGGGLQATGEPVFYLDIRPAADSPVQIAERVIRWSGDVWWRASGGSVRAQSGQD